MTFNRIHLEETDSTNRWLKENGVGEVVVVADYQTAGRGQGTHSWESERGMNLLFSVLVHPVWLPVERQYLLSEAWALSLRDALAEYVDDISVKWPNDIYWRDRKISGTLIETRLSGGVFKDAIIGTGINVNQQTFVSDAPNPVSLWQITSHDVPHVELLDKVLTAFDDYWRLLAQGDYGVVREAYHQSLYRREGNHLFRDSRGEFEAAIVGVADEGLLTLMDQSGKERRYAFGEVSFVL